MVDIQPLLGKNDGGRAGRQGPQRKSHARAAHVLVYGDDAEPGFSREPDGDGGFRYRDRRGRLLTRPAVLARIRALAIPPAWTDVWICPRPNGHLQATGRDARGRKQYRYHPAWTAQRDASKFVGLRAFGKALPRIRRRVRSDLARRGLPRERVLALAVALLDLTLIRVGGAEYARRNRSYGLTTLQRRHTRVAGAQIRLRFRGKSGVQHDVTLRDRRLATLMRRCLDIPGQRLFKYRDEHGLRHAIDSTAVNEYLREISGGDFTAKDFRTWGASVMAHALLRQAAAPEGPRGHARQVAVIKAVAERLANTPAVCRKCYIHPAILAEDKRGGLAAGPAPTPAKPRGLRADERRFLAFLRTLPPLAPPDGPGDQVSRTLESSSPGTR